MYRIELLLAAHGDALWVEYGDPTNPVRILVDGGPAHTYDAALRAKLESLRDLGSGRAHEKRIDLFVVTHIDCDHIDGAIIFLREYKSLRVTFDEIWFNAWRHIAPPAVEAYRPLQGEFLGALVATEPEFQTRWNTRFAHNAVVVSDEGVLPRFDLPQNANLTLLSPYKSQLDRLRRKWSAAIRDFNPGDEQAALARLNERRDYRPPSSIDEFSAKTYGADPSVPNASSIAFILEHGDKSCLFTGDAHARVLVASLRRLARERGVDRVRVDAVKLPHHGSMNNISEELLSLINCDTWLISTNGDVFEHPDRETVELIGKTATSPFRVLCNYQVDTTRALEPRPGEHWSVIYPGQGASRAPMGGLQVDLLSPPATGAPPPPAAAITLSSPDAKRREATLARAAPAQEAKASRRKRSSRKHSSRGARR
jgi:hypothetical protein